MFKSNIIETFFHFLGVLLEAERDSAHLLSPLVDLAPATPCPRHFLSRVTSRVLFF